MTIAVDLGRKATKQTKLLIIFILYFSFENSVDIFLQFSTYKESLAAFNSFLCSAGFLLDIGFHLGNVDFGKVD